MHNGRLFFRDTQSEHIEDDNAPSRTISIFNMIQYNKQMYMANFLSNRETWHTSPSRTSCRFQSPQSLGKAHWVQVLPAQPHTFNRRPQSLWRILSISVAPACPLTLARGRRVRLPLSRFPSIVASPLSTTARSQTLVYALPDLFVSVNIPIHSQ